MDRDVYRLKRIEDGREIVMFYSAVEARTLIGHLDMRYRLMLGDRQIWPDETSGSNAASSGFH